MTNELQPKSSDQELSLRERAKQNREAYEYLDGLVGDRSSFAFGNLSVIRRGKDRQTHIQVIINHARRRVESESYDIFPFGLNYVGITGDLMLSTGLKWCLNEGRELGDSNGYHEEDFARFDQRLEKTGAALIADYIKERVSAQGPRS